MIVSVPTLEIRSAMVPPDRMQCALKFLGLRNTCEMTISTTVMSYLLTLVLRIADHLFWW